MPLGPTPKPQKHRDSTENKARPKARPTRLRLIDSLHRVDSTKEDSESEESDEEPEECMETIDEQLYQMLIEEFDALVMEELKVTGDEAISGKEGKEGGKPRTGVDRRVLLQRAEWRWGSSRSSTGGTTRTPAKRSRRS